MAANGSGDVVPPPVSRSLEVIREMLRQQHQQKDEENVTVAVPQPQRIASAQMLQLAAATAQCEEDALRRATVLELVGRVLSGALSPAVSLHCFGSSANGLGTSDSDLDIHLGGWHNGIYFYIGIYNISDRDSSCSAAGMSS